MCGIVGYIGKKNCLPIIINALETLEYRGYDSAGIAYIDQNKINIEKEQGRIVNLKEKIDFNKNYNIGIGHTRWATHGKPCKENSHPHQVGKITLVHNGIVENYEELKKELGSYTFKSDTDSEVVAALIDKLYNEYHDMIKVLSELKNLLIGSYALGIIVDGENKIYTIRKDSPLIIGVSDHGNFIASDVPAILEYTNKYYLLLNDEFAIISENNVSIYDENGDEIKKELMTFEGTRESALKDGYEHFMLKEMYEQPKVVMDTIKEYITDFKELKNKLSGLEKYDVIDIVGCGSAYHAGMIGKSLITKYGLVQVNVDIASEYRYTEHVYNKNHLIILISQSGETADTLAVIREAKKNNVDTLAIVNVVGSSIAREADRNLYTKAGPEIAVATTKAYLCQIMLLSLIALYLGVCKKNLDESIIKEYANLGILLEEALQNVDEIKDIAKMIYKNNDVFYLGRKVDYAISLEASLKLKEVSYLHSEAYAAGELKHGTISLIEENTPVISIVTDDDVRLKTLSNIKEVRARHALSIIISNESIQDKDLYDKLIIVPKVHELISSAIVMIKCQLIAYYVAKYNKCDIDKPRNLAKSVTVE